MTWTRAIARITVGGEQGYLGTGALISESGLVLTAFHVIADHEASKQTGVPAWHKARIEVVFGDPKNETWKSGDGSATRTPHFSIDDDWALLQLCGGPVTLAAPPLPLAAPDAAQRDFETFGFPRREAVDGGNYKGTIGPLEAKKIELLVENLPIGAEMRGISGAPCIVNGRIVGVIQQARTDDNYEVIKASLYMLPIDRAIPGFPRSEKGWDDGTPVVFQEPVEGSLPTDSGALGRIGGRLKLPAERRDRKQIARCILDKDVETVADALVDSQLPPPPALTIIEAVGAMWLHREAVAKLCDASKGRAMRTPVVASETPRIHRWFLRRAFHGELKDTNKIVILPLAGGHEELSTDDLPAAQQTGDPNRDQAEAIAVRVREVLHERGVGSTLVAGMLSAKPSTEPQQQLRRRFWLILLGERRPGLLNAVRARLPNAIVIAGLAGTCSFPEQDRDRFVMVHPTVTLEQETQYLEAWESAASQLKIPLREEENT